MAYKSNKTWRDLVDQPEHFGVTRRQLLQRGLATGVLSALAPNMLLSELSRAYGQAVTCPPATSSPGAIAQLYAQGGPTMGARFIGTDQANMMNATIASNYGISGTNLVQLGTNLWVDSTSPFGMTLLQGPPGYVGGAAAWKTNVLNKCSGGGHRGPFNADDGAGQNTGLLGGVATLKSSQLNKDVRIGVSNTLASWANGLPSTSISGNNLTPAGVSSLFGVTPASTGLATSQSFTDASNAAMSLSAALSSVFNNTGRNGASTLNTQAGCAILGNSTIASPTFGSSLFTPSSIAALTSSLTVASLSAPEQAQIAAYYQSAMGVIGGVICEFGGRDYHGQSPQTVIAPADIEDARAIVMFLAACAAANAPGAMIYLANGQAIANGVQSVAATIGTTAVTVNAPVAKGDAGGAYNAGLIIFFDPNGSPPVATMTGTIASNSGNATVSSSISSSAQAVSGLYLSALKWINGGTVPQIALTTMNISSTNGIMVI